MGQLSRAEMEAVIASGGSVLYNGQTITQVSQLPSEAALAQGDPAKEAAAADALHAQIADLQAQIASLQTPARTPTGDNPIVGALDPQTADKLAAAGFTTPEQLSTASDDQLLAVAGVGDATLKKIRAAFGGG